MTKIAGGIILAVVLLFVVIPLTCGMCVLGTGVIVGNDNKPTLRAPTKPIASSVPETVLEQVTYTSNCNARQAPQAGSKKVGMAKSGVIYDVVDRSGKWRLIKVGATHGWCGCKAKSGRR